jgi:phage shock protein PspC (stress-responsive transcriptional regulator)
MKKTIKINLGGVVFHIDEDAYDLLRNYLDQLDARFNSTPGGSEILGDIETRMAELFQARITAEKEVLTLSDATEVIDIMGEPEEIDEEIPEEEPASYTRETRRRGRRMYRDPDNQVVGGVCSGLGAYLNIDPVFVRILFVVFTMAYGVGILIYFLFWVVVPEARTAAEKLEMYGEEVNVFNIEKKVRQDYRSTETVKGQVRVRRRGNVIGRMVRALGTVILVFIKIIGFIILGSFAIAGIALLASLIAIAVGGHTWFINAEWNEGMFRLRDVFDFFVSPVGGTLAFIAVLLLVAIPVLGLIYGLVRMIFRFKAPDRAIGLSSFGVWVIALIVLLVIGINEGIGYSNRGQVEEESTLTIPAGKTLMIKSDPAPVYKEDNTFDYHGEFRISRINDSVSLEIRPNVRIEYTRDSLPGIRIKKTAHGANYNQAKKYAGEIEYNYQVSDTTLTLEPSYKLSQKSRFHAQELEVIIRLPEGTKVYLDKNLEHLLYAVDNTEDTWSGQLAGDSFVMTPEGLSRQIQKQPAGGI